MSEWIKIDKDSYKSLRPDAAHLLIDLAVYQDDAKATSKMVHQNRYYFDYLVREHAIKVNGDVYSINPSFVLLHQKGDNKSQGGLL